MKFTDLNLKDFQCSRLFDPLNYQINHLQTIQSNALDPLDPLIVDPECIESREIFMTFKRKV